MATYKTRNGQTITADTADQVVAQMRDSGLFTSEENLDAYMHGVAERELVHSGKVLNTQSAEHFVSSALAAGLLEAI